MRSDRFNELADKFDTFYLNYKKENAPGKTYIVATTNFDTPYIQGLLAKAPSHISERIAHPTEGQVTVFSYSNNSFRSFSVDRITRLSMLSVELDKEERNANKRRFHRA